jgi:hypothetical protein
MAKTKRTKVKKNSQKTSRFKTAIADAASELRCVDFRLALISFIIAIMIWASIKLDIAEQADTAEPRNSLSAFQKE